MVKSEINELNCFFKFSGKVLGDGAHDDEGTAVSRDGEEQWREMSGGRRGRVEGVGRGSEIFPAAGGRGGGNRHRGRRGERGRRGWRYGTGG